MGNGARVRRGTLPAMSAVSFDVVIPTVGRASLLATLIGLAGGRGPWPEQVVIVDDRPAGPPAGQPIVAPGRLPDEIARRLRVLRSGGRGPGAARNVGWRAAHASWIAFLDDDVVPDPSWRQVLAADLDAAGDAAGSQGRVIVPLPAGRRPTDRERDVGGLGRARWATADMAYRRAALEEVGGFDERFPRAYREDADLALRLRRAGGRLTTGRRVVAHPVRHAPWHVSIGRQAGNADDMLMRRLHGRRWRRDADAGRGRATRHLVGTGVLVLAAGGLLGRSPRLRVAGAAAAAAWCLDTGAFAVARIRPGPRTAPEVAAMIVTSAAIPPAATFHLVRGVARARRLVRPGRPAAVLLDRDGTLVRDVPYNGDPCAVEPMPGAREALDRLRVAGVPIAVISNQSGVARGTIGIADVHAVNARIEELLGPLGPWQICTHDPTHGCPCRKPEPGLVRDAAAALGVDVEGCVVIGDIGADVEAARRAGARGILVPTGATRHEEITAADVVAGDLGAAVDLLIGPRS